MDVRNLIIMRHAKSDWNGENISDFDRPLNQRGLKDAPRMASWFARHLETANLTVDLLISSPALRARQTSDEIIESLKLPDDSIIYDKRMYLASTAVLLEIIRETDDSRKTIMLVGHNPGLENLSQKLSKKQLPLDPDGSLMTTANIIHLQLNESWVDIRQQQAEFVALMRPRQLPG